MLVDLPLCSHVAFHSPQPPVDEPNSIFHFFANQPLIASTQVNPATIACVGQPYPLTV
jgi:hypothetical protein